MAQPKNKKRRRSSQKRRANGGSSATRPPAPAPPKAAAAKGASSGRTGAGPVRGGTPSLKSRREEAPKPIWAPIPVTEVLILIGLIVAAIGLAKGAAPMVIGGLVILGAASTELAAREHLAGYRSHSGMLGGLAAVVVTAAIGFGVDALGASVPVWALLAVAVIVFLLAFSGARRVFRRRTGGLSFRV